MTSPIRKELWLKAQLAEPDQIRIGVLAVQDNEVLVSQATLEALYNNGQNWTDDENDDTWRIKYPILAEILTDKGYRKWDEEITDE